MKIRIVVHLSVKTLTENFKEYRQGDKVSAKWRKYSGLSQKSAAIVYYIIDKSVKQFLVVRSEQDHTMQSTLVKSTMSVVQPRGNLNASNAADLQQQLAAIASSKDYTSLLVDMSQVESLDSAGLMALVSALQLTQQLGQRFGLCGISPSIRIIFELTQLDCAFEIFENQGAFEAIAA